MKIALMTEGTYPFAFGGVSVRCDQLIRGMPGYEFHVVALVATATEPTVWALPGNVVSLVKMPLWGPAPVTPAGRRGGGRRAGLPLQLLRQLIDILLDPYAGRTTALRRGAPRAARVLLPTSRIRRFTVGGPAPDAVATGPPNV